jgi:hypothetical protein
MSRKARRVTQLSRRDFIRALGVGAATIPFLPNWLFRLASAAPNSNACRLVGLFHKAHGATEGTEVPCRLDGSPFIASGVAGSRMVETFANNHRVWAARLRDLQTARGAADGSLSPLWGGAYSEVLDYLNIYCGFNQSGSNEAGQAVPTPGHGKLSTGNPGVDPARNEGRTSNYQGLPAPTVDAAIAGSALYRSQNPIFILFRQYFNGASNMVHRLQDPTNLSGPIEVVEQQSRPDVEQINHLFFPGIWQDFFGSQPQGGSDPNVPGVQAAIDHVLLDLNGLRQSALVGSEDRFNLERHQQRLVTLRDGLAGGLIPFQRFADWNSSQSNSAYNSDRNWNEPAYRIRVMEYVLELLVWVLTTTNKTLFFSTGSDDCDGQNDQAFNYNGAFDKHHLYHFCSSGYPANERREPLNNLVLPWTRSSFENTFLKLAKLLKNEPSSSPGMENLLDQCLLTVIPEAGPRTHDGDGMFAATLGKANLRLEAGNYVDLYDRTAPNANPYLQSDGLIHPDLKYHGPPWIHFLNHICRAAGLGPTDYSLNPSNPGYFRHVGMVMDNAYRRGAPWNYGNHLSGLIQLASG